MRRFIKTICLFTSGLCLVCLFSASAQEPDADALIEGALDYMRGKASVSKVTMTIHRPTWEREMTIKAWTEGRDRSLFYIVAPPKDEGNGTLLKDGEMWTYNPKINRVVKIPPSMMSQSWMGSDFSNNDLAKSDDVLHHYTHSIEGAETHEGMTVYLVTSTPKPQAPVVWGMQQHRIREDFIVLSQEFFDQEKKPVKKMTTRDIQKMDGKLFPIQWKMQKTEAPEKYTLLEYQELDFQEALPARRFTIQSLKNPRR